METIYIIKRFFYFILIVFLATSCNKHIVSTAKYIKADEFLNPSADFRSAPFYSLNDKLDTLEIIRQISGFKQGGFGGSFLHSRAGLLTEYLGEEWWSVIGAAVKASREVGMKAWFYDEDKWPSGFGGGRVPLISEDYHSRYLARWEKYTPLSLDDQLIFEDDKFYYVCVKSKMGNPRFNGTTYVDLFNHEAVKSFIEVGYTPYCNKYVEELGKTVPGIFTDEPQISTKVSGGMDNAISFSPVIVKKFKEQNGYDLLVNIPSLFDTVGNYLKIRYDYYQTISRCYEESYAKQIGEYCKANNIIFTGHFNGEESFKSIMMNAGNTMINYRHMQMPGMDQLGLRFTPLNVPKSVSSVANQYGIARRLSECYGIAGQNMNFEDRKWILDWHIINGINFVVPHLSLYSMKGARKRDYPPNFSPAQPYWDYNKIFEDYTGRMCYINTIGKYAADILVIHPLESEYLGSKNNCYEQYDKLLRQLQNNHRNYDLGDEQIIADIAQIRDRRFVVGQMYYKLVILPSMLVVRNSTIQLLEKFKAVGGNVIVIGKYPDYVDGEVNTNALNKLKKISKLISEEMLIDSLNIFLPSEYKLGGKDTEFIWTNFRKSDNGGILQLSNTSRLKSAVGELTFSMKVNNLALWNPETGKSMKLSPAKDGKIKLHFSATQTLIITFGEISKEADMSTMYHFPEEKKIIKCINGAWEGKRLNPNALTLDYAQYSIDSGKTYSFAEPVIGIHQRLENQKFSGHLLLKFEVLIKDIPSECSLVLEQPELYDVSINKNNISFDNDSFYIDPSFRTQCITQYLEPGKNEILLKLNYSSPKSASLNAVDRYGTEIESIYLTGNFAVNALHSNIPLHKSQKYRNKLLIEKPVHCLTDFFVTKELTHYENDLTLQGYPFYSGSFLLRKSFDVEKIIRGKKYFISFPFFEAIVLKIKINGTEFAPMLYSPWEFDITNAIKEGHNDIEIVLTNSLRNLLGPHHHSWGELIDVGPSSFTGNPIWPNQGGEENWYDLRINGNPTLWRDDYSIIPFGLLKSPEIFETIMN